MSRSCQNLPSEILLVFLFCFLVKQTFKCVCCKHAIASILQTPQIPCMLVENRWLWISLLGWFGFIFQPSFCYKVYLCISDFQLAPSKLTRDWLCSGKKSRDKNVRYGTVVQFYVLSQVIEVYLWSMVHLMVWDILEKNRVFIRAVI